jgi:hypothetical protein
LLLVPEEYNRIKGWRIYGVPATIRARASRRFSSPRTPSIRLPPRSPPSTATSIGLSGAGCSAPTAKRSYGIYGIPHWKTNRGSADPGKKGRLHIWRPYDYRRIFAMYFAMNRIARDHPHIPTQLGADTACTIVVDDPVFGRICYGGGLAQEMARLPLPRATASGGG